MLVVRRKMCHAQTRMCIFVQCHLVSFRSNFQGELIYNKNVIWTNWYVGVVWVLIHIDILLIKWCVNKISSWMREMVGLIGSKCHFIKLVRSRWMHDVKLWLCLTHWDFCLRFRSYCIYLHFYWHIFSDCWFGYLANKSETTLKSKKWYSISVCFLDFRGGVFTWN